MNPDIVVDIGNSRIKWGRCTPTKVVEFISVDSNGDDWSAQFASMRQHFGSKTTLNWAVAGVQPHQRDRLVKWLRREKQDVLLIDSHKQIPLQLDLDPPEQVGIDRLLSALGSIAQFRSGTSRLIVDAGTAVTVNLLDAVGIFRGGFIMPGLRLQALSLREHTAKLPLVEGFDEPLPFTGRNTRDCIRGGIVHGILGGIEHIRANFAENGLMPEILFTGGDGSLLAKHGGFGDNQFYPTLTLEGIRLASSSQS